MADPTVSEIKNAFPGGVSKSDATIQAVIDRAIRMRDNQFSSRIAREGEIEGNADDFAFYLSLHLLTLEEGGEVDNESQTGGTVTYSHLTGNGENALTETRWGRTARTYLRDQQSIGIEIT